MDNYSKQYVKTNGSAPFNGNYIHQPAHGATQWKGLPINNSNPVLHLPLQLKENVATSSQPQTNLPRGNFTTINSLDKGRASRGLSTIQRDAELVEYKPLMQSIGRYSGLYTSARGKGAGRTGSLNPIKHWRKQLMPAQNHVSGKPSLDSVIWNPGGSTVLAHTMQDIPTECCGVNNVDSKSGMLFTYIYRGNQNIKDCNCQGNSVIRNELSNFQPVALNNPERISRPRSSQTLLKKNYYTTGAAYLKSRVKLYEQNQTLSKIKDNNLVMSNGNPLDQRLPPSNNNWVYPTNDPNNGSQVFNSNNCISDASACCNYTNNMKNCQTRVIFKPNNPFYGVQGAVDASTRILQAKFNAINTNNNDFTQTTPEKVGVGLNVNLIAGDKNSDIVRLPGATPMKYRGDSYRNAAPYFIKSKYQRINACSQHPFNFQSSIHSRPRLNGIGNRLPSGGTGIITTCFYNAIQRQ
mgnify:CR=1 FL=1